MNAAISSIGCSDVRSTLHLLAETCVNALAVIMGCSGTKQQNDMLRGRTQGSPTHTRRAPGATCVLLSHSRPRFPARGSGGRLSYIVLVVASVLQIPNDALRSGRANVSASVWDSATDGVPSSYMYQSLMCDFMYQSLIHTHTSAHTTTKT